jgi:hypothetical protein
MSEVNYRIFVSVLAAHPLERGRDNFYCSITPLDLTLRSDKLAEFSSRYASNMARLPGP